MCRAGGPCRLPVGWEELLLPETGLFLLFPSRVCPAVSNKSGEGPCRARGGSPGHEGEIPGSVCSPSCLPVRCSDHKPRSGLLWV